jgi:hypothetical protein
MSRTCITERCGIMDQDRYALDEFGRHLIRSVRDRTIREADRLLYGESGGDHEAEIDARDVRPHVRDIIRDSFVPGAVDTVLHYLLWGLEQEESIIVSYREGSLELRDLARRSDALCWEIETEEGWITLFSEEREPKVPEA